MVKMRSPLSAPALDAALSMYGSVFRWRWLPDLDGRWSGRGTTVIPFIGYPVSTGVG